MVWALRGNLCVLTGSSSDMGTVEYIYGGRLDKLLSTYLLPVTIINQGREVDGLMTAVGERRSNGFT